MKTEIVVDKRIPTTTQFLRDVPNGCYFLWNGTVMQKVYTGHLDCLSKESKVTYRSFTGAYSGEDLACVNPEGKVVWLSPVTIVIMIRKVTLIVE